MDGTVVVVMGQRMFNDFMKELVTCDGVKVKRPTQLIILLGFYKLNKSFICLQRHVAL